MDHSYIDDNQIAERYLLGKLPAAEAARFEEHSLGCSECLDRLEMAERLHRGLSRLAAAELAGRAAVVRAGILARLAALSRSRQALLGALAILVMVLPIGLLLLQVERLDRQLAAQAATPAPAAAPAPGRQIEALSAQLTAARGELMEQKERQERALAAERREREGLTHELERARRPQVNTPIVPLSPERSAPGQGAPTSRIALAPDAEWVVLSLDVEGTDAPRYRVTLVGAHGDELWKSSDLKPSAGSLALSLPRALLPAGDYRLRVEGLPATGSPFPAARFAFRIVRGS